MIYLDYNATAPIDPAVRQAMLPFLSELHGNASSSHALGRAAGRAVDAAREQVASLIGAFPDEIVFTSGGSESNNHVIKGVADTLRGRGDHIITSAVEHPAIRMPCAYLEKRGFRVTRVPVDGTGMVNPDDVKKAVQPSTVLISVMHANNEVGTIQPIAEISRIAREASVWMHTDAAQSIGKMPVIVGDLGVEFLSLAGHKFYAPAGIGALFIRRGIQIEPLILGAGHEAGRRAGTSAVVNIVGLGAAAHLVQVDPRSAEMRQRCHQLQRLLEVGLGDRVRVNSRAEKRLPNTLNASFVGENSIELLSRMPELCASPGAACRHDAMEPSAVLTAMGVPRDLALGAIRFSLGRPTTDDEIKAAAEMIIRAVTVRH
ncbi:MAG: cysteine desulfurase [Phycisphaerales bacterium]|nr:cysteine desulfurase [Phycisphaerales bacterium]